MLSGSATFSPTSGGTEVIAFSSTIAIHPNWTGDFLAGSDLAVITLAQAASSGVQGYSLYTASDEIDQNFNAVGYGRRGSFGAGTNSLSALGSIRQGMNTFDATLADINSGSNAVLLADFDNGLVANDFFNFFFGATPMLGLGFSEVATAPGDSGGPGLLGGQIAAIFSFGATLGTTASSDISPGVLNSSYGEIFGSTRVSSYSGWITAQTSVPVPTAAWLMGSALLALGGLGRRRSLPR